MSVKEVLKPVGHALAKHSPEILTGVGIAGMVLSTVLAVKATPKATRIIEERKANGDDISKLEIFKSCWKFYLPSALIIASSAACLIGAASVNFRRNAAMAAACAATESALATYKDKVIEVVGEKKEKEIRDFIHKDEIEEHPVSSSQVIITEKGNTLCFDPISSRYFRSDIEKIRRLVNDLNVKMLNNDYISLNDLYYGLGLDPIGIGWDQGWSMYNGGYINVYFSAQIAEDGEPAVVMEIDRPPRANCQHIY